MFFFTQVPGLVVIFWIPGSRCRVRDICWFPHFVFFNWDPSWQWTACMWPEMKRSWSYHKFIHSTQIQSNLTFHLYVHLFWVHKLYKCHQLFLPEQTSWVLWPCSLIPSPCRPACRGLAGWCAQPGKDWWITLAWADSADSKLEAQKHLAIPFQGEALLLSTLLHLCVSIVAK